jgi:hypothetical protein
MGILANVPIGQLAVLVAVVTAIVWVAVPGMIAIVVTLIAGAMLALKAMSGQARPED